MTARRSAKSQSRRGGGGGWLMRLPFPECSDVGWAKARFAPCPPSQASHREWWARHRARIRAIRSALPTLQGVSIMAALVLSVAGAAAGAVFGPAGAIVGRIAGALVGNIIDRKLFGPGDQNVVGPRLADLDVMASTEGAPIPRVYGRARLAGQVIWATQLEEVVSNCHHIVGRQGASRLGAAHDHHDLFLFRQFRGWPVRRRDRRRRADLGRRQAARPHRQDHPRPSRHRGAGAGRSDRRQGRR